MYPFFINAAAADHIFSHYIAVFWQELSANVEL